MTKYLSDAILPNIIFFRQDHTGSVRCTDTLSSMFACTWTLPTTWSELGKALEQHGKFLAFHADIIEHSAQSSVHEFVDAIRILTKFMHRAQDLKIAVVIKKTTPITFIKELQKTSVQGILLDLNDYPVEQVVISANALVNGIPYWPKEILKSLPGNVQKPKPALSNSIKLTGRQQQVLALIRERGASNKIIARSLGITESTVKLHVTTILKKFGVKNRTQLAVFSLE